MLDYKTDQVCELVRVALGKHLSQVTHLIAITIKMLKKATLVVIGSGDQDFTFKYGYDYTLNYSTQLISRSFGTGIYPTYNSTTSLYNNSKYASVGVGVNSINVQLGGSGKVVQFGVESTVDDTPVSIQKIDIYLKTGKTA